ncbi:hypothetical protein C7820_4221 [Paenibacillus sp. VMFN-D1]|nr:hypothetical protein C7820_4221 [Paenibacillus sp. VMFN-D1]
MKVYCNGRSMNELYIIVNSEEQKAYKVFGNVPVVLLDYLEALRIIRTGEFEEMCPGGLITISLIEAVMKHFKS